MSATISNVYWRGVRPRTLVARAVARATPIRTMANASPRGMAKAKVPKAKVDEEAVTANLTRTRKRTRGNRNSTPGGNPDPSGGQPITGPTTRSQTQGQQEKGTKCANDDGDQSNARKRSRFMRMARKLQKKGFEVTCRAEF